MKNLKTYLKKRNEGSNIFVTLANILAACITMYYFLPIASYYVRGMYVDVIFVVWFIFALIGSPGKLSKTLLLSIGFLILFSTSIAIMNLRSFATITMENITIYTHFFTPIYFFLYYFNRYPEFLTKLAVIALLTLSLTSITTLIQLNAYFYISKLLTAQLHENAELLLTNVANINMLHSFVIICPLLFVLTVSNRHKMKLRIAFGGFFALFFLTAFKASFSIIMIIVLFGSMLMLIKNKKYVFILCSMFFLLIVFKQNIAEHVYSISI